MAGTIGLLAALLALGMSSAPGRLELRWFALIAACAALFDLSNVCVTLRVPEATVLVLSRFCLFFGGLHATAWFKFYALQVGRPLTRGERVFVAGGVALAFLSLVPDVVLASFLYERTIPWLGVTYADAPPTTFGVFAFAYHLLGLVFLLARYLIGWRNVELRAPCIALAAVVGGVAHDGLVSSGHLQDPYVLDMGVLILVLFVGGWLTRSFVANAKALETSLRDLAHAHAELVKKERLAALGELAAVVAHEVRNPLAVVFNALASLRKTRASDAPRHDELVGILQEEAERLRDIVSDLLEFARPRPPVFALAALDETVTGAVGAACEALAFPEVAVEVSCAPLPSIRCDERLVRQAIVNLVTNALQAPGRKGAVRVDVALRDAALVVSVSDDGAGVPAEDAERIFTPFYSTRPSGTGLGLAVVRACAEAHDGTVTLRDTPGGGATFTMRFPRRTA